jgi:hypothetical protein
LDFNFFGQLCPLINIHKRLNEPTGKIFKESFKAVFRGKLIKFFFGSFSGLGAIFFVFKSGFNWTTSDSMMMGVSIVLSCFFIAFLYQFGIRLYLRFVYSDKESQYGEAILHLRDAFSAVHALRRKGGIDDQALSVILLVFCSNLKTIFDKKTSHFCNVSIKVSTKDNITKGGSVVNISRNVEAQDRDTEKYQKTRHTILGNTAFQHVLIKILANENKLFYINNDIKQAKDYLNTSKSVYKNGLPYSSELVYPIVPHYENGQVRHDECLGFICIDCDTANVFDEIYDVGIVSGVADGLYDIFMKRNQLKNEQHGQTED